jgi:amidase
MACILIGRIIQRQPRLIIAMRRILLAALMAALTTALLQGQSGKERVKPFEIVETTIDQAHAAYKSGKLTARQLVQSYLDRIRAYDQQGPKLNAIIILNPNALEEADRLDARYRSSGLVGPLHGWGRPL